MQINLKFISSDYKLVIPCFKAIRGMASISTRRYHISLNAFEKARCSHTIYCNIHFMGEDIETWWQSWYNTAHSSLEQVYRPMVSIQDTAYPRLRRCRLAIGSLHSIDLPLRRTAADVSFTIATIQSTDPTRIRLLSESCYRSWRYCKRRFRG